MELRPLEGVCFSTDLQFIGSAIPLLSLSDFLFPLLFYCGQSSVWERQIQEVTLVWNIGTTFNFLDSGTFTLFSSNLLEEEWNS